MFDDILKIKVHKEERALSHLEACREKLAMAEQAVMDGQKTLEDYKVFRKEEKVRLFKKVQNEQVSMQKIDQLNRDIAKLKEQELAHIKRLEELRQDVQNAKNALEQARVDHQQAQLAVQKYEEIKSVVDQEKRAERELREEVEQEDLARRMVPVF
jgi:crotonobetainyl-CoA:carnitine CoA-transferase CaiB-like acyl-CoA transferase